MKLNKLLAGLGAAVLTAALAITVSAADPVVVWDFANADDTTLYNEDGTVAFSTNGVTATYDAENACLTADVLNGDPYLQLPDLGDFPAENRFVRVKYYQSGISDWSTSIYFTTDTVAWSETGHWKGIYDGDDDEWCEQTFYMDECPAWAGTITAMRLDVFDSAYEGQLAKVAYVAVFGSEEDANNFDYAAWRAAGSPVSLAAPAADAAAETAAPGIGEAYPASGTAVPDGSVLIRGELIGSEMGWGEAAASGRHAAFDGNVETFFDPATASVDYCGIDAGEEMILTKIVIHPRTTFLDRFDGATIEASNDPDFSDSVEIFYNDNGAAAEIAFVDCSENIDASANTGYRYFRYINYMQHGDVAEVELYGYAKDGSNPDYSAGAAAEAPAAAAPAAAGAAAEPTILWDFNSDEALNEVMSGANAVSYFGDTIDGVECYEFLASGNDPYVSINISADSVDDVVWAKARVKNPSYATAIELFGATNGRSLAGSECTHIELKSEDEAWYTYLIYIPEENVKTVNAYKDPQYAITEPYWAGTVEFIRLDPLWREGDDGSDAGGNMEGGESVYIDYIAFFPTKEDALAFRPELDNYAFPEQGAGAAAEEAPAVEEAPAAAAEPTIFANATVVEVSGLETEGANTGDMAIDGDMATRWSSNTDDAAHIIVDLGAVTPVDSLDIYWETACAADYTVEVSEDNENWTVVATVTDNAVGASPVGDAVSHSWDAVNARYIKINCTRRNTEWGNSIWEMVAYACEAPVVEEAPAVEEPVAEEVVEAPAEEPAEEAAEEAPAAAEVVEEAPETFDFGVIAAVAALVSAAGYAISKKR